MDTLNKTVGYTLSGTRLHIVAIALALCAFMQVLDGTIANVSLPHIAGDLAVNPQQGVWVITMFAVGNAISLPLTGWISKSYPQEKVITMSVMMFSIFSWLCGISFSINMLMACRFAQGLAAGPLIPLSQSLMVKIFPKGQRPLAISVWNMVIIVGPVLGPITGGWITSNYSWPWIFFINLPIGAFCMFILHIFLSNKAKRTHEKIGCDIPGIAFLVLAVSSLQILLDQGPQLDWWRSEAICILALISICSFIALFIWEYNTPQRVIDFRFFLDKKFALGTLTTSIVIMVLIGSLIIVPLWLQEIMGYTALLAGFTLAPVGVFPILLTPIIAKLMKKEQLVPILIILALLTYSASLLHFTNFTTSITFFDIIKARLYLGLGLALLQAPLMVFAFSNITDDKLPMGQGIFHFARALMNGIGASLFITLWERRGTHHHSYLTHSINKTVNNIPLLDKLIWKEAYVLSLDDIFYISSIMLFLLAVVFAMHFIFHKYSNSRRMQ